VVDVIIYFPVPSPIENIFLEIAVTVSIIRYSKSLPIVRLGHTVSVVAEDRIPRHAETGARRTGGRRRGMAIDVGRRPKPFQIDHLQELLGVLYAHVSHHVLQGCVTRTVPNLRVNNQVLRQIPHEHGVIINMVLDRLRTNMVLNQLPRTVRE